MSRFCKQGLSSVLFVYCAVGVLLLGLLALPPAAQAVSNGIVISQVYGGGGNTGAPFKNDFIELFNRGNVAVNITGWSVQYASSTGSTWSRTVLSGVIPPGGYYLVQEGGGSGIGADLPTPDATGTILMSLSAGKVALVTNSTTLAGTCPGDLSIVDLVGYGAGTNCSEGAPAGVLSNTTSAHRNTNGCVETDDNSADFTVAAPAPRNSSSPAHSCQYTLDVSVDPVIGGSAGKSPDQATYLHGASVTLTASAVYGYHFVNWSGDVSTSANPVNVTMDANKSVVAHFAPNPEVGKLVISQVYGGGGNSGATYRQDFIELYNPGIYDVDVTGWSVQYSGPSATAWIVTPLAGTVPSRSYFLVREGQGAGGTQDLPSPDVTHDTQMNAVAGKVALVNGTVALVDSCPPDARIVDLVGYGGVDCFEAAPTPSLNNTTAALRDAGGCVDTDNNLADFGLAPPGPRNTASPINPCAWAGVEDPALADFQLGPPVPNPTHGMLRVPFSLPGEAKVQLRVFDIQGRVVSTLVDGTLAAGPHEAVWTGAVEIGPAASGIYFIRLQVLGRVLVQRVVLAR